MATDEDYMREALREAEAAYEAGEVPVGAVLVKGMSCSCEREGEPAVQRIAADSIAETIVARAHNLRETTHDATAHAEVLAIRAACARLGRWRLADCTLYVTLEPCPMCAGAIVMSRLGRVVYGAVDSRAGACESIFNIPGHPSLRPAPEIRAGVLDRECEALLKRFFREQRKKPSPQGKVAARRADG